MSKQKITVSDITVRLEERNQADYICITDIAKQSSEYKPAYTITNWLRNQKTLAYLATWEQVHNPDFKVVQMNDFRIKASDDRGKVNPQLYIETTNAIGIVSKSGRYGGTYAHSDIAFEFCSWLSPEFKVYLYKEFQRLKADEARREGLEWNLRREIAKANYSIHTDAVKNLALISQDQAKEKHPSIYANEADLLNVALFGCTAKQWKANNPDKKGNIRDFATADELLVLSNLQSHNARLIKYDCDIHQRLELLSEMAKDELRILKESKAAKRLGSDVKRLK